MISAKPIKANHRYLSSLQAFLGESSFAISLTCFLLIFQTRRFENPTANLETSQMAPLGFLRYFCIYIIIPAL